MEHLSLAVWPSESLIPLEEEDNPSNIPDGICFRPRIQAPHGCEALGALEYPIGWIEKPDYEDHLGARNDSPHPHHALRRLKDMGDSTYVLLLGYECAVRAGGGVEACFRPRI